MTDYLLDTNILVNWVRRGALYRHLQARYGVDTALAEHKVSVVSFGELRSFARQQDWGPRRLAAVETLLAGFTPLDINTPAVLAAYVEIDVASHSDGRDMGKNDLWIAATARARGIPLLTSDNDFDHLPALGLVAVEWVDPAAGAAP